MSDVQTILIVEDEALIAMDLEDIARGCGFAVLSASNNQVAREILASRPVDFVLLDINLSGEPSFDVAQLLAAGGIPFAFCTGSIGSSLPEAFQHVPIVPKPFSPEHVIAVLASHLEGSHALA